MISVVGEITGEYVVLDATTTPTGGFRRRIQAEKTLDGGAVVIDYGEDIAGAEISIEANETECETTLRQMDRISLENNTVLISMRAGCFRGVPKSSENGKMIIVITERCA